MKIKGLLKCRHFKICLLVLYYISMVSLNTLSGWAL